MGGHTAPTTPLEPARGPRLRALLVLALGALALVATSPALPTLEGYVIGEVVAGPGETIERQLRIHVAPEGGGAARGSITVVPQAASGLSRASTGDVQVALNGDSQFPVERCLEGCDLDYRVSIATGPGVLPLSVIRYEAYVRLEYDGTFGARDPRLLRIDLEGATGGPVAPLWSLLAGLVALIAGIHFGPRVHRALPTWRRTWPAAGLIGILVANVASMVGGRALDFTRLGYFTEFGGQPSLYLALFEPWSLVLFVTLAWGIWQGLQRWPDDRGELLGLAAVAAVGLGGLWLAWATTDGASVQPIVLAVLFAALGGIGGVVIAQAWGTDPSSIRDPWWASLAVLSHGVVIAGFGFLVPLALYDPFASELSYLAVIPLVLVAWAFHRWLRGRQRFLVAFDVLIALAGLLGVWFVTNPIAASFAPDRLELDDVAVWTAVIASLVGLVTACHSRGRREAEPVRREPAEAPPPAPPKPPLVLEPPAR